MAHVQSDSEVSVDLLSRIEAGESRFDELFSRYRLAIRQAVSLRLDARTRARFDESDVVQEAYTVAYRRLDDYLQRRPMPFGLWLRKTALEQLLMLRRRHVGASQRTVDREQRLPEGSAVRLAAHLVASGPSPSAMVSAEEQARRVRRALSELPLADQEVLLMRNYEGLSYDEIGHLLDIEPATARQRNGRALVRLHRLLADSDGTQDLRP